MKLALIKITKLKDCNGRAALIIAIKQERYIHENKFLRREINT